MPGSTATTTPASRCAASRSRPSRCRSAGRTARDHAPRVHTAAERARRPVSRRDAAGRLERGDRPSRLPAVAGTAHRPRSGAIHEAAKYCSRPGGRSSTPARACTGLKPGPSCGHLAELLAIPVCTSLQGKSAFPETHPLALGSGGLAYPATVHHFLKDADLIFGIGCTSRDHLWRRDADGQDDHPRRRSIPPT